MSSWSREHAARHSLGTRTPPSRDHREGDGNQQQPGLGVEEVGNDRVGASGGTNTSPICLDDRLGSHSRSSGSIRAGGGVDFLDERSLGMEEAGWDDEEEMSGGISRLSLEPAPSRSGVTGGGGGSGATANEGVEGASSNWTVAMDMALLIKVSLKGGPCGIWDDVAEEMNKIPAFRNIKLDGIKVETRFWKLYYDFKDFEVKDLASEDSSTEEELNIPQEKGCGTDN